MFRLTWTTSERQFSVDNEQPLALAILGRGLTKIGITWSIWRGSSRIAAWKPGMVAVDTSPWRVGD
jgi:hypothetical protein